MKPKQLLGSFFVISGIACIGLAAYLFIQNQQENLDAQEALNAQLPLVQEEMERRIEADGDSEAEKVDSEIEELVLGAENIELPSVPILDNCYLGILSIPTLQLELPIMDDWNYERLKKAPCRYFGSPHTDDFVIAGHNYESCFGKLSNLHLGDPILFTDMDGRIYYYTVGEKEILNPTEISAMIESPWALSLYTCTYGGQQRVTIRCNPAEAK